MFETSVLAMEAIKEFSSLRYLGYGGSIKEHSDLSAARLGVWTLLCKTQAHCDTSPTLNRLYIFCPKA